MRLNPRHLLSFLSCAALAAIAIPALAQSSATAAPSCPVEITSATYMRHAKPLPVPDPNATTRQKAYGTLDFHYRNATDKPVRAFHVSAMFTPQPGFHPPLWDRRAAQPQHYTQSDPLAAHDASSAHYEVQQNASGLSWLRLDKVEYQDGSTWNLTPGDRTDQCTYHPPAKPRLAEAGK
jgi:hypothetical protein